MYVVARDVSQLIGVTVDFVDSVDAMRYCEQDREIGGLVQL